MRRLWIAFTAVIVLSFAVLGWTGVRIYQTAPPIPQRVVSSDGSSVVAAGDIDAGQNVWQSLGGMELGSIWGHGSYVAPDWTADWLHREATYILDDWARQEHKRAYADLDVERQGALQRRLEQLMHANRYDAATGVLTIERVRARAYAANAAHYAEVFRDGRPEYAIPDGALTGATRARQLAAFFFWSAWAAAAAVFSALEVVPLLFVGFEAWHNLRLARARPWIAKYRWPIYFFVAVAFWNLVGAGLFGFMINPPIALYYMQGLNTTPVHGHAALFGVYGMLGIGLMLFCFRALRPSEVWREGTLSFAFWAINGGLSAMILFSLLPVGLMQTWASVEHGYWYARSPEFLQTGVMQSLRWARVLGDTLFAAGILSLGVFVAGLATGWSLQRGAAWSPETGGSPLGPHNPSAHA